MGVQRGGTVGIELGFYRGISAAWAAKGQMYVWGRCFHHVGLSLCLKCGVTYGTGCFVPIRIIREA